MRFDKLKASAADQIKGLKEEYDYDRKYSMIL